ncbi:MAG: hypothetical protein COU22_02645 [Candidatus Komeilibacteria bacterium CG10_big_fil_rev_8_21_14_0_10_41_13]|uniref:DUF3566 domain-containing protein n=1 Tax=Candidatus Komeilibacteria bacterium CG10_big_fil_rev_8_21_14_0_10_41_13 TaxID=1974476 RepID=A0A2M6WC25_9BACT|nr:MAG: hypothetical protein COU22_02645 [Candidatus Komeilibacteria bacterium CG10_big_fil_rev_8_21_14_0_10_41_13]
MREIKKIDTLSVAKIFGLIYGGVYLVVGLAINLSVLIFGLPAGQGFDLLGFGSGILATFLVALLVGALSFVSGIILAWIYNRVAQLVGGIKWSETEASRFGHEHLIDDHKPQPQDEVNHILDDKKENNNETFSV